MPDIDLVLGAFPRVLFACRAREVQDPAGAGVLTDQQARILRQLDTEDPMMVTELADFMGVTASTMSLNLTRLEKSGFVTRARDPEDRRVMNVRLTESGARICDLAMLLDPDRVDALLRLLSKEDRPRAVEGLALLAEAADALVARGLRDTARSLGDDAGEAEPTGAEARETAW